MANIDFKNALIGQKVNLDPSWPQLRDDTNARKKSNLTKVTSDEPNHLLRPPGVSDGSKLRNKNNLSGTVSHTIISEFPELSSASVVQSRFNSSSKSYNLANESSTLPTVNHLLMGPKCTSKHSKYKSGTIHVPLLSLVKTPCKRNIKTPKRENKQVKLLCGNKLDADKPLRRKGKVRLFKKKYVSRLKKEIHLSRLLKNKPVAFSHDVLKVKHCVPALINDDDGLNIDKLSSGLHKIAINDKHTAANEGENALSYIRRDDSFHDKVIFSAKHILHSNNFREYCTNVVTSSLLKNAEDFITTLRNFQDRSHAKNAAKAFAKRRYVCGFKETKKFLLCDRVKLTIVATNLQLATDLPSGRVLEEIKSLCLEKNIPLIYVGRGNQIGYWTLKRRRISIVSVLFYEGAEEKYRLLLESWGKCKEIYKKSLEEIERELGEKGKEVLNKDVEEEIRENIMSKLTIDLD